VKIKDEREKKKKIIKAKPKIHCPLAPLKNREVTQMI
jgi:hypothetical protein